MNRYRFSHIVVLLVIAGPACHDARPGADPLPTISLLKQKVLDRAIDSLPAWEGLISRDTLLGGDEGVSWKAKAYYYGPELEFLAETSWEDAKTIRRITVSGLRVSGDKVGIGRSLKEMRPYVSDKIPTSPDGYLFLDDKADSAISFEMDVSHISPGWYDGITETDALPDTLRVESIVILSYAPAARVRLR